MRARRCGLGIAVALAAPAMPAAAACGDLLPPVRVAAGPERSVTPGDLVAIRDVGFPDALYPLSYSPLALSPDGTSLAFVMARADRMANAYCRGLVVVDLSGAEPPRLVDRGGDFVPMVASVRGLVIRPGAPDVVTPVWSPDGRTLAYRKRVDGRTEAWLASADGSGARRVARLDVDVEDLAWSVDGRRLVLRSRPAFAVHEAALGAEGRAGYLYDDRFQPNDANVPAMAADPPQVSQSVDLATLVLGPADERDAARFAGSAADGPVRQLTIGAAGRRAWLVPDTDAPYAPLRIRVQRAGQSPLTCKAEACRGAIRSLSWIGDALVYLRREGWANGSSALYRWMPGAAAPRRLHVAEEAVHGCVAAADALICLAESAATTRRIVRIDPEDGARRTVFDPNPDFRSIRLGEVRRLNLRNDHGLAFWADLVLPAGYRGGRIPMVVVQYFSDGFLRGGTGDEYPVHAFAARGIAVLSINRPKFVSMLDPSARMGTEQNAVNWRGWAERKNLQSAIEVAVAEAVRIGVADPERLGITGLSDGASSAVYALINSRLFSAAAISSASYEPYTNMMLGGPRYADFGKAMGLPDLGKSDPALWAPMSLAQNAGAIAAPILIQAADREYLLSLESWTALKQAGKPVEMYVFPDEYHNKWQPAHRSAAYARNLDWFEYWLAGVRDADPSKAEQYRRWDRLKKLRDTASARVAAGAAP